MALRTRPEPTRAPNRGRAGEDWLGRPHARPPFGLPEALSGPPEPAEFWLGLLGLLWGLWIGNPWVSTFASSPGFRGMAELAPEAAWGATFLLHGLATWFGLFRRIEAVRRAASWAGVVLWSFVAFCTFTANPFGLGLVLYGADALVALYVVARLSAPRWR